MAGRCGWSWSFFASGSSFTTYLGLCALAFRQRSTHHRHEVFAVLAILETSSATCFLAGAANLGRISEVVLPGAVHLDWPWPRGMRCRRFVCALVCRPRKTIYSVNNHRDPADGTILTCYCLRHPACCRRYLTRLRLHVRSRGKPKQSSDYNPSCFLGR